MAAPADGVLDLERELSCSICTDVLFHPLTLLDCLHTFCGSCLKEWFAWQASSATTRHPYTCPACRATVRGTRPNATVTTLLDMFLKAHPERGKSLEDRQEMEKAYTPGDDVIPPVQVDEHSDDSEDERALAEARALSLNDTEPPGGPQRAHRRQRRRHDADSPGNTHSSYRAEDLGRAQRPSAFLAQRRQLERQSSLRSLMSASDLDSADMEEEIMRQIMEEGLLDGIDLNSLSATQEEEITERIAQAFRARQRERSRQQAPSSSSSRPAHSPAPRDRQHQRPPNSGTQQITSHPPPSRSHLLVGTAEGGQRRQHGRTSSSASQRSARSVASASDEASVVSNAPNTFTRSATDLSQRPRDELRPRSRRSSQSSRRRTTDPERRAGSAASHQERATMEDRPAQSTLLPGGRDSLDANPALAEVRTPTSLSALRSVAYPSDNSSSPALAASHATRDLLTADDRRPTSSSAAIPSPARRINSTAHMMVPSVTCSRCEKPNIEHSVHYHCSRCSGANFNLCIDCYRAGKGCLHWYGFGYSALARFQQSSSSETTNDQPHILSARRYNFGSAVLEEGLFCEGCLSFANPCYWHCDHCNDGAWGYCNECVQKGKHCTHPLESVGYTSTASSRTQNRPSGGYGQDLYPAPLNTTKSAFHFIAQAPTPTPTMTRLSLPHVPDPSLYTSLMLTSYCDICQCSIPSSHTRLHCHVCSDGDYDICTPCYHALVSSGKISASDGPQGWRRCPRGHRISVIGFEDREGGPKRVVVRQMVGGWALKEDTDVQDHSSRSSTGPVPKWSWKESDGTAASVPSNLMAPRAMPPDGGVGLRARTKWSYFPPGEAHDELAFPRNAIISEVEDINGDWFWGVYAGKKGLFPGNYVKVI